ncbi:MAG: hypothetical protein Q9180_004263 [Flavoplaca navasiana]
MPNVPRNIRLRVAQQSIDRDDDPPSTSLTARLDALQQQPRKRRRSPEPERRKRPSKRLSQVQHIPLLQQHQLERLDQEASYIPTRAQSQSLRLRSNITIKNTNTAISVTNNILEAIENIPLNNPLLAALDADSDKLGQPEDVFNHNEYPAENNLDADIIPPDIQDPTQIPQRDNFNEEDNSSEASNNILGRASTTAAGIEWGIPPTRRSSVTTIKDDSEPVPHRRSEEPITDFSMAFGI